MAGIDKTYTDSYKEYRDYIDWARGRSVTFFNNHKVSLLDFLYEWEEEDFTQDRPIMNTPSYVDAYLIQNCPLKFIKNRTKTVYSNKEYDRLKNLDLTAKPDDRYQQNRKIQIQHMKSGSNKPLTNRPYYGRWFLCNDDDFRVCRISKVWTDDTLEYPKHSTYVTFKTIKSAVRHLRKQYLPVGAIFYLESMDLDEDYIVKIKK